LPAVKFLANECVWHEPLTGLGADCLKGADSVTALKLLGTNEARSDLDSLSQKGNGFIRPGRCMLCKSALTNVRSVFLGESSQPEAGDK
jgi:hypothetical protein